MANRPSRVLGFSKAAHDRTLSARPRLQPSSPLVSFGSQQFPNTPEGKASLDSLIASTGNRPPSNDLYDKINFLQTGRRSPRKPSRSYGGSSGSY